MYGELAECCRSVYAPFNDYRMYYVFAGVQNFDEWHKKRVAPEIRGDSEQFMLLQRSDNYR
jgi:hypothetical protein